MVQHRNGSGDIAPRAPLVLDDGDLLWKCWITNVHRGVQVQILSAKRVDGRYSVAIAFVRDSDEKKPTARFWVKHELDEECVVAAANDIMVSVSDNRLHFRLIDLSQDRTIEAQMAHLRQEGFEILCVRGAERIGDN